MFLRKLQWIPGSRGSVWDQHRRTYNGEGATGDEKSEPLHLRSSGRARLQLAPQEGLLSAIRPLGALQNTLGQRPSALSKETVSSSLKHNCWHCERNLTTYLLWLNFLNEKSMIKMLLLFEWRKLPKREFVSNVQRCRLYAKCRSDYSLHWFGVRANSFDFECHQWHFLHAFNHHWARVIQ